MKLGEQYPIFKTYNLLITGLNMLHGLGRMVFLVKLVKFYLAVFLPFFAHAEQNLLCYSDFKTHDSGFVKS